jgi:plasmid stability protein
MTAVTIDLPTDVYQRLHDEASRAGKSVEAIAQELLIERLVSPVPVSERERATEILRAAGLLTEPGPEMKARAARSTATLEEVRAAFARSPGKPLSEIVIEQRGPKV